MISTTAQYALRSVIYLAKSTDKFVSRSEIAEATFVPQDYLLKVLNLLDSAGLVQSRRGPGGGYRLTQDPADLTVLQVVSTVEEIPRLDQCPLGITEHTQLCPMHAMLDEANRRVEQAFQSNTIADLIPQRKRSKSCDFPQKLDPKPKTK